MTKENYSVSQLLFMMITLVVSISCNLLMMLMKIYRFEPALVKSGDHLQMGETSMAVFAVTLKSSSLEEGQTPVI